MIKVIEFIIRFILLITVAHLIGWLCILLALVFWNGKFIQIAEDIMDLVKPWGDKYD